MKIGSIMILASVLAFSSPVFSQDDKMQEDQKKEQSGRKESIVHYSITVHGNVQGVGFRNATKQKADELGIKGEVRNEPDGTVFIEAEGTPEKMQEFIAFTKEGPEKSDVKKVDVKKKSSLKHYTEFDVDRISEKNKKDSVSEEKSDKKSDHKGNLDNME